MRMGKLDPNGSQTTERCHVCTGWISSGEISDKAGAAFEQERADTRGGGVPQNDPESDKE